MKGLLAEARKKFATLFFADQGYTGNLKNRCLIKTDGQYLRKLLVEFEFIFKRWIVERTFAWLSNFRRMSKDYEHSSHTSKPIFS